MISVVSYPDRGQGGDPAFRGNCSPRLLVDLFRHFKPHLVLDPMVGSGTTRDVAKQMGIPGFFDDLATGFNVLQDEPPACGYDLAVLHPPYYDMVIYTGGVHSCPPHPDDLSRCRTYAEFLDKLNEAMYRCYEVLARGGYLAVLVGDLRRHGCLFPISRDMRWYGEPEAVVIKEQHHVRSATTQYRSAAFVAIMHETLVITRKPDLWLVPLRVSEVSELDVRRYSGMTWQALVYAVLSELGGEAELQALYGAMEGHTKVRQAVNNGTDWQAQVRKQLQIWPQFQRVDRGRWRVVTHTIH